MLRLCCIVGLLVLAGAKNSTQYSDPAGSRCFREATWEDNDKCTIVPCGHVGVEIYGVNLSNLSEKEFSLIREQFLQHGVIFFREQSLTPEDHLRFARRFGPINVNRFFGAVNGYPEIAEVKKEANQTSRVVGEGFHTDHSYDVEPALGSVVVARELPKEGGGTFFVDMRKAYESLPAKLKERLESMNAVHSSRQVYVPEGKPRRKIIDSLHPVVITHPVTRRKTLYVNPGFTYHFEGMTVAESRPLLEELYHHAVQSEHVHRFNWRPGSVAVWDNRAVWHCAVNDYHGERRVLHRVTIEGSKLSELNDPDQLTLQVAADIGEVRYDPNDNLNSALKRQALEGLVTQATKL